MLDEKLLIEKADRIFAKSYFMREGDFMQIIGETKEHAKFDKKEIDAYDKGYEYGLAQGKMDAAIMHDEACGCTGCAFEDVNEWEMPCAKCSRGCKDYWRAKKVE